MAKVPLRDGNRMHVHIVGRGPTVVMLHGFAMQGLSWLPSVLPLAHRYRFVLPDLRGFGRSHSVPFARADVIEGFADDLEDLLDWLGQSMRPPHDGKPRVSLAGLSMGGLTSLAFAARGGLARVNGYVHVDQAARIHNVGGYVHGLFGPAQAARFALLRELHVEVERQRHRTFDELPPDFRNRIRGAFAEFFRDAFHASWWKSIAAATTHELVAKHVMPLDRWFAYADCMKAYLDVGHDYTTALARAHAANPVPLTFMVADRSEMYPAEGQLELARIVGRETTRPDRVSVVRFPRSGHAIPYEAPIAFVRELRRALDRAHGA